MIIAAVLSLVLILSILLFQIALVLGAPLGHLAWGGQHKVLPRNLRIGSAISIVVLATFAAFIASKASLWELITNETVVNTGLWVIFAYFVVGVFMNSISRSKPERYTMAPLSGILAVCVFMVASS